jgi:uncharacterized protein YxeA
MKKIIIFVLALVVMAIIADHFGYINLPSFDGDTGIMDSRDKYMNKSSDALKSQ